MPIKIYEVIINLLIFYFLESVVNGVTIREGNLIASIILGLIFGLLMASVLRMLQFFKISVNVWSSLLLSIIVSFVFFFILYTGVGGVAIFGPSTIDFGISGLVLVLPDALSTLLFLSLISAITSVGLKQLAKRA